MKLHYKCKTTNDVRNGAEMALFDSELFSYPLDIADVERKCNSNWLGIEDW